MPWRKRAGKRRQADRRLNAAFSFGSAAGAYEPCQEPQGPGARAITPRARIQEDPAMFRFMTAFVSFVALASAAAAPASAALPRTCSGGLCAENFRIVEGGSHAVRFSFRGTEVSHYNVRFVERGGRTVQREVSTMKGDTNQSKSWRVRGTSGQVVTIHVQACNRAFLGRSSCTKWYKLTITLA
jgi:hypothetical protein